MEAVAHSEKFAKKVGVPMSVGKDFSEADKGRKFGTGGGVGITRGGQKQINKQTTRYGSVLGNEKNIPNVNLNKHIGKKDGGIMKPVDSTANPGLAKLPTDVRNKMGYMKKGGKAGEDMKMDKAQDKAMIKKAIGMHDKQEHKGEHTDLSKLKKGGMSCAPKKMAMGGMARMASKGEHPVQKQAKRGAEMVKMAKGGLASGHKSADGIAQKGKTRAMRPEMRKGGKVC